MATREDGERAERLTNTLFGSKDGGRHRQERPSSGARSGVDEFASHETTLRLSYGFRGELTVY